MSQPFTWSPQWSWNSSTPGLVWNGLIPATKTPMAETKVNYPVEEVLGFCQSTKAMVNTYKTEMIAAGVDPTAQLAKLDPSVTKLNAENAVQENIKTQLRNQTPVVEAARNDAYGIASNLCDMVLTAFGRTSEQAREAMRLRKSLRPVKSKDTPAPTP
jgi:hypothetical protein